MKGLGWGMQEQAAGPESYKEPVPFRTARFWPQEAFSVMMLVALLFSGTKLPFAN